MAGNRSKTFSLHERLSQYQCYSIFPPTYFLSQISRSELPVSNNIIAALFFQLFPLDTLLFSVTDISSIVRLCHSFPLAASQHLIFDLTSRPAPQTATMPAFSGTVTESSCKGHKMSRPQNRGLPAELLIAVADHVSTQSPYLT